MLAPMTDPRFLVFDNTREAVARSRRQGIEAGVTDGRIWWTVVENSAGQAAVVVEDDNPSTGSSFTRDDGVSVGLTDDEKARLITPAKLLQTAAAQAPVVSSSWSGFSSPRRKRARFASAQRCPRRH